MQKTNAFQSLINTPLGTMHAVADENFLYLLEFVDSKHFKRKIANLTSKHNVLITPGKPAPIVKIEQELHKYFAGTLKTFTTPIALLGTPFQTSVWNALNAIPHGQTHSYGKLATTLSKPSAFRAVALANAANQLAIIIPCHRVINANGTLSGYGGGVERKQWLLNHEIRSTRALF